MLYTLKNNSAMLQIDSLGAEIKSFKDVFGTEYMWSGDPAYWKRTAPVLFPIVGSLRNKTTVIDGQPYTMGQHGFARDMEFRVLYQSETRIVFCLKSNAETKKMYPYEFDLLITYTLEGSSYTCKYEVVNMDDRSIYFALGAHPGFNCPVVPGEPFENYQIEFGEPQTADCPYVQDNGVIAFHKRRRVIENAKVIPLNRELFAHDALIFDSLTSKTVRIVSRTTGRGVEMDFNGFDYLGIWQPRTDSTPFVCLEPWVGIADCDDSDGVYEHKRGIRRLEKSESFTVAYTLHTL